MTCAAILPWLSYGEKDHVTFLFFGKNVSPSSWGITSSSEDDASCSPPLLNHCSIVPYEHLKKKKIRSTTCWVLKRVVMASAKRELGVLPSAAPL